MIIQLTSVLVPIAMAEWAFLRDPKGYAAVALLPLSAAAFVGRTLSLWMTNFAPWRWAFARPVWYAYSGPVIPVVWMAAGSVRDAVHDVKLTLALIIVLVILVITLISGIVLAPPHSLYCQLMKPRNVSLSLRNVLFEGFA